MNTKFFFCLFFVFLVGVSTCFSQEKTTVISMQMNPNERMIFNMSEGNYSGGTLEFKNHQTYPDKIVRKFLISKPTHLFYSNTLIKKDHTSQNFFGSLLILPGDSINIGSDPKFFVDNFLDISRASYRNLNPWWNKLLIEEGVSKILDTIENNYKANIKKIKLSAFNEGSKSVLLDFSYLLKISEIAKIPFRALKEADLKIMDSLQSSILENIDKIYSINSLRNFRIYYFLVSYSAFRKGNVDPDFWNFFNLASNEVKQSTFYKPFLFTQMDIANKQNPDKLAIAIQKMKMAKIDDKLINGYYDKLTSFDKSRKIGSFSGTELNQIALTNTYGRKTSLKDVITQNKGKIIMIDFWASWCVPCRSEFPKYEELKSKYLGTKLSFINISIDLDNAILAWKKALNEEKVKDPQNHFRLINPKESVLIKKLGINTIPRYIIIDSSGNIIDGDAMRPSNPEVFSRLNTIIKNIN